MHTNYLNLTTECKENKVLVKDCLELVLDEESCTEYFFLSDLLCHCGCATEDNQYSELSHSLYNIYRAVQGNIYRAVQGKFFL